MTSLSIQASADWMSMIPQNIPLCFIDAGLQTVLLPFKKSKEFSHVGR